MRQGGEQPLNGQAARLALKLRQQPLQTAAEWIQESLKYRLNQGFLGAEMIVDGGQIDPGLAGNGTQTGFGEPLLREQDLCSIENAVNGAGMRHKAPKTNV